LIRYPQNWLLLNLTGGKQIEIYYQPDKNKSVGEILIENLDSLGGLELYNQEKTIGVIVAKCKTDGAAKTWCYLKPSSKYVSIMITADQDPEYNKTLDQVLSTFKFLK